VGTSPTRPPISAAELDVLKALWDEGPKMVRELNAALKKRQRRWAHNTVWTLLQRLEGKGYVASDKGGWAHVFRASLTREDFLRQRLDELATEVCQGASGPLVLALVAGNRFTPEEISQFLKLLDRKPGQ
jgi:BlaI family transcriptional regulator, penicillinase repressor